MKAETIKALRGLKVHTKSLNCLGCGHEPNCGIHGCAIIRKAMEEAEQDARETDAVRKQNARLERELFAAQEDMKKVDACTICGWQDHENSICKRTRKPPDSGSCFQWQGAEKVKFWEA